jgi:F0F1-type ATP synthase delta subunit
MNRSNLLRTTLELQLILEDLEKIKRATYQQDTEVDHLLNQVIADKTNEFIRKNVDPALLSNPPALSQEITRLIEQIEQLTPLQLTIAIDPSDEVIEELFQFVTTTWGSQYIIDIVIDREIVGGAIIMLNGHYYDFSLKKQLDEVINQDLTRNQEKSKTN